MQFLKEIIREAGEKTLEFFGKAEVQYTKSSALDIVTQADLAADKIIFDAIRKKYPDHGIISEERKPFQETVENIWIYDPLDGTRNFANRLPLYGVMIGLVKNGVMEISAIYLPIFKELFFAEKGKGAYLNDRAIHCSNQQTLDGSTGCLPIGFKPKRTWILEKFVKKAAVIDMQINFLTSAAVSAVYVADGRRDWIVNPVSGIWDHAAAALLLQESGCRITTFSGEPWKFGDTELIAANPVLHKELFQLVKRSE